jgi:hypothetical protein
LGKRRGIGHETIEQCVVLLGVEDGEMVGKSHRCIYLALADIANGVDRLVEGEPDLEACAMTSTPPPIPRGRPQGKQPCNQQTLGLIARQEGYSL